MNTLFLLLICVQVPDKAVEVNGKVKQLYGDPNNFVLVVNGKSCLLLNLKNHPDIKELLSSTSDVDENTEKLITVNAKGVVKRGEMLVETIYIRIKKPLALQAKDKMAEEIAKKYVKIED